MKNYIVFLCLLTFSSILQGQPIKEVTFTHGCNFASEKTAGTYTLLEPTAEAGKVVDEILRMMFITRRPFTLQIATIENAQATKANGVRYLLYSDKFMDQFKKDANTKWAAYFVFAHEIAHLQYDHDFRETDKTIRQTMESEADCFAAKVLTRLGANEAETLAALVTMKKMVVGQQSAIYPSFSAREEQVSKCSEPEELSLGLDSDMFNPWNLLLEKKDALLENDKSKLIIHCQVPPAYVGKTVNILLCTADNRIKIKTVKGTGTTAIKNNKDIKIEWNYKADGIVVGPDSKPILLKVFIYTTYNKPTAAISPQIMPKLGIIAGTGLLAVGTGTFFYLKARKQHHDIYLPNTELDAQIFTENGATDRADFYQKINRKFKTGQIALIGGGLLVGTGIVWAIKNKSRNKKAYSKAICQNWNLQSIEPVLASNKAMGVGFRFLF